MDSRLFSEPSRADRIRSGSQLPEFSEGSCDSEQPLVIRRWPAYKRRRALEAATSPESAVVSSRENRLLRYCHDELYGADAIPLAGRCSRRHSSRNDETDAAHRSTRIVQRRSRRDGGDLWGRECHDAL